MIPNSGPPVVKLLSLAEDVVVVALHGEQIVRHDIRKPQHSVTLFESARKATVTRLIGGPDDGVIASYQDGSIRQWDSNGNVLPDVGQIKRTPVALRLRTDAVEALDDVGNVHVLPVTVTAPVLYGATLVVSILYVLAILLGSLRRLPLGAESDELPHLLTDRPLDNLREATPSMQKLVQQLVRFLRNPNTPAPLTFAVTGQWGSGKSSLLNLVAGQLSVDNRPCIWFNAWHHRTEEHLFAALMESIRTFQAPPAAPDSTRTSNLSRYLASIEVRLNLYRLRIRRSPVQFAGLLLLGTALAAIFVAGLPEWPYLTANTDTDPGSGFASVVSGVGLIWLAVAKWKALKVYDILPAKLVRAPAAWIRFPHFAERLGFRYHFGRAFGEVCDALADRPPVIIVDDLDRCNPEQMAEVLEAVNFLTSNGKCFVLLALSEDCVEPAIGQHYKAVAEEIGRGQHAPNESDNIEVYGDAEQFNARMVYAREFLRKLINVVVKVPAIRPDDLRALRGANAP